MSAIKPTETGIQSTHHTLLVVDDTPGNLDLLGELLKPDYLVRVAKSGARALEVAVSEPKPDLILLDVMMPGMDGWEVLERLRANPATREIPVIFITAMDGIADEERGLLAGAVDYITKPIHPVIVRARVRAQLDLKRARDLLKNQNLYLDAEIDRRKDENLLIQDVAIHALARLAETRDPETGNHLRRTQGYVRALGRELQSHPRFAFFFGVHPVELLAKSAPLHDIGKVGIPDKILLKPGKLTPKEWAIMQTHAKRGSDAIEQAVLDAEKPVEFLTLAKEIAHWHHEKWDGSGYPDRLKGEAIPIPARLMAMADVFDALISPRVYKRAFPFTQARAMIAERRGRHFDPDVTDAFLSLFDEFVAIAERYSDAEHDSLAEAGRMQARGP